MNDRQFLKHLEKLQGWREMAFILALAERSYPNYAMFAALTRPAWGERIRECLDHGWRYLSLKKHDVDVFKELARLETAVPEPEEHDMYGVHPALDMVWLLEQAFLTQVNPDKRRALDASQRSLATVTGFVEVTEGDGLSDDELVDLFDRHELVRLEWAFQKEAYKWLRDTESPLGGKIDELIELAANDGVSNLGLDPDRLD
ncbi:YjaG family protein [Marinobacteraceae bacterium S3BR75-40.1]